MTSSIFSPATHLVFHSTFFKQSHSVKNVRAASCVHKEFTEEAGLGLGALYHKCLL